MTERVQLEPGWLLSLRAYRETSALLEVFTARHGRVGLVAKGARGSRSRLRGLLQPLQPLLLSWQQAGELGTLTSAEAAGVPLAVSGERLFYGWYLNELLLRLLQREDPHPATYAAYEQALGRLAGPQAEFALRLFEKELLADIGYGLELPTELDAGLRYELDAEGSLRADVSGALSGAALTALRDGQLPPAAPEILAELRRLMRTLIARQLGGRELETPKLLRELRQMQPGR